MNFLSIKGLNKKQNKAMIKGIIIISKLESEFDNVYIVNDDEEIFLDFPEVFTMYTTDGIYGKHSDSDTLSKTVYFGGFNYIIRVDVIQDEKPYKINQPNKYKLNYSLRIKKAALNEKVFNEIMNKLKSIKPISPKIVDMLRDEMVRNFQFKSSTLKFPGF